MANKKDFLRVSMQQNGSYSCFAGAHFDSRAVKFNEPILLTREDAVKAVLDFIKRVKTL